MSELNELMQKLSEDPHREKSGRIYLKETNSIDADKLMEELSLRAADIADQHRADEEAAKEREELRRRLHPGQYDRRLNR